MTFTVRVDDSEIAFPCEPREFVLDAAERAGYSMPSSCRKGACNTCEAGLLEGEVEQRGRGRRTAQDSTALMCRSQPRADLTIRPRRFERIDIFRRKSITTKIFRLARPAPDVTILTLRFPIGLRAPFKAGQYLQVVMEDGDRRNFSMANATRDNDGAELHIRHVPGGKFSMGILSKLSVGDPLQIEAPYGDFYLRGSERPVILLASGTGFAPIKSIIETAIHAGNRRPMHLYWGVRKRDDIYLAELPARWAQRLPWFSFTPVLSRPPSSWTGRTGRVHEAVRADHNDLSATDVYACGNPVMISAAQRDFVGSLGLPDAQFFADAFVEVRTFRDQRSPTGTDPIMNRCPIAFSFASALLVLLCATNSRAEDAASYPSQNIKIIVPFPAGGTADILPRIVAEKLRQKWGKPVIIENRSGAGGNIGAEAVASSAPDGYTLLASPPGPIAINENLYRKLSFRPQDLMPITVLGTAPNVLDVRPDFPAKTVKELIDYAKANPEKVTFASQGNGTTSHLTAILFEKLTGVRMVHVPYRGTAPALQDIIGNTVDLFFDNLGSSMSLHLGNKLRILGVCGAERVSTLADVPTVREAGVPDFTSVTWFALMAPKGTSDAVLARLNSAVTEILREPDIQAQFLKLGVQPAPMGIKATAKFIDEERVRWGDIIKSANVTFD